MKLFLLTCDYVADMAERRLPYRQAHLDHAAKLRADDAIVYSAGYADPFDGSFTVFWRESREAAEAHVQADPYVTNHLVRHWKVRELTPPTGFGR